MVVVDLIYPSAWYVGGVCGAVLAGSLRRTGRYLALVPGTVVLEVVEYLVTIWVDQVNPCLPQRMYDIVDKAHLQ